MEPSKAPTFPAACVSVSTVPTTVSFGAQYTAFPASRCDSTVNAPARSFFSTTHASLVPIAQAHSAKEYTPDLAFSSTVSAPKTLENTLNVPVAQREVINFQDNLESVVAAKCTQCHVPTFDERIVNGITVIDTIQAPGNLDLRMHEVTNMEMNETFPQAYFSLAGGMEDMMGSDVVRAGFSRRSRLIDVVLGVGTAAGDLPHPQGAPALTAEEKRWFTTWVDLGAQYR
jgi:hypothetical protein